MTRPGCKKNLRMASMQKLSADTVRLITSAQVITSIVSITKELIENSLDAGSDNIEVKLDNHGFDKIEVRDNGSGIKPDEAPFMARRHFTSKISQHADLQSLATYGFRGEALGSLCAVSSVSIVTKTSEDDFGHVYVLDHEGSIITSKPSHLGNGTTVTATHLFKNIPVRKQYYTNAKRRRDELKKVEDLMMSYGAICPAVRFSLSHNKSSIWQKSKVANHKAALISIWGSSVMSQMQYVQRLDDDGDTKVRIEGFVPRLTADNQSATRAIPDRCWIAVNGRPITFKEIEKMVKQSYCQAVRHDTTSVRHLVMFLSITLPQQCVDVNLEPNKTKVMLQNKDVVLSILSHLLEEVYGCGLDVQSTTDQLSTDQQEADIICTTNTVMDKPQQATALTDQEEVECGNKVDVKTPLNSMRNTSQNLTKTDKLEKLTSAQKSNEPTETCSDVTNLPPNHGSSSCVGGPVVQRDLQLNFSIFDDDFERDENFDEKVVTDALDETRSGESDFVKPNLSKEASNWSTNVDDVQSVSRSLSLTDWSKGRGLIDNVGKPVEPATLLIPTNVNEERPSTNHSASNQFSANHIARKSASPYKESSDCTLSAHSHHISSDTVRIPNNITHSSKTMTSLPANQETEYSPSANQKKRSPGQKRLSLENKVGKGILYDLVGQSTVRRPQSPFAFFSKEMRPQVVEKNPRANFSEIAKTVEEKWMQLDEEETEKYEEMGRKDGERYRNQLKSAQKKLTTSQEQTKDDMPSRKKKKTSQSSNQGLIDKMLLSQQQRIKANQQAESKTPDIPSVDVSFNLIGLERMTEVQNEKSQTNSDHELHLIGQLASHGVWLARHGNQLMVFNQYRVEETFLYHRLMAKHVLPCQPEDIPIMLSPSMLGGDDNWNTLLRLPSQSIPPDPAIYYTDERLIANGFDIKQTVDSETKEVKLQVIAITTLISYYGIDDLKEILELIKTNQSVNLTHCRPLKVSNYLKGEAVRMARTLPSSMPSEDVHDIIKRMKQLPRQCIMCLHNLPFEHPLCLVPQSQV